MYGSWLEFLAANFAKCLDERRSQLPSYAVPAEKTQIYWVEPPTHYNFDPEDRQMREICSLLGFFDKSL